jgi:F0F1-type ATP synthase membrane subunit c/vacuolar-type H+-ATPase subunit K
MSVERVLKFSFVFSAVVYAVVAVALAGAPDWGRPLIPEGPTAPLFFILLTAALAVWFAGFAFGRRQSPPAAMRQAAGQNPWSRTRLVIAAALIEAGALFGLVLSIVAKDSRPAIAAAAVTVVLLLILPTGQDIPSQG